MLQFLQSNIVYFQIDDLKPKASKSSLLKPSVYFTDEEVDEEDYEKDPDWKKTPLFHRIRKIDVCSFLIIYLDK